MRLHSERTLRSAGTEKLTGLGKCNFGIHPSLVAPHAGFKLLGTGHRRPSHSASASRHAASRSIKSFLACSSLDGHAFGLLEAVHTALSPSCQPSRLQHYGTRLKTQGLPLQPKENKKQSGLQLLLMLPSNRARTCLCLCLVNQTMSVSK